MARLTAETVPTTSVTQRLMALVSSQRRPVGEGCRAIVPATGAADERARTGDLLSGSGRLVVSDAIRLRLEDGIRDHRSSGSKRGHTELY
ncbi:hypothetical protein AN216_05310 [Streptomyces oceani]|uniref:Uncharacterized protein n=1 Tax=Streptomyces oceani TaxID=1075402 RepID=A0A1E7KLR5_9ACTN|nr:hypothetical protein AN216_05310 [Streptomyces oceani]